MLDPDRMLNLFLQSFPAGYGLGANDSPTERVIYITRQNKNPTPKLKPTEPGYVPSKENVASIPYIHFIHVCSTSLSEDQGLKRLIAIAANGPDPIDEFPQGVQDLLNQKIASAIEKLRAEMLAEARAVSGVKVVAQVVEPDPVVMAEEPKAEAPLKPKRKGSTHLKIKPEDRLARDAEMIAYAEVHGLHKPSYIKGTEQLAAWWIGMVKKHQRVPQPATT